MLCSTSIALTRNRSLCIDGRPRMPLRWRSRPVPPGFLDAGLEGLHLELSKLGVGGKVVRGRRNPGPDGGQSAPSRFQRSAQPPQE